MTLLGNNSTAQTSTQNHPSSATEKTSSRVIIVSSPLLQGANRDNLGSEGYSYHFVYKAYRPLLEKWGRIKEVKRPESQVNFAFRQAEENHQQAWHMPFFPPQALYLSPSGPTVAILAWEFSTIPNAGFGHNMRNNWLKVLNELEMVITLCEFTRQTLIACGITVPVRVVVPPVAQHHFTIPAWDPNQTFVLNCPGWEMNAHRDCHNPQPKSAPAGYEAPQPDLNSSHKLTKLYHQGKAFHYSYLHKFIPPVIHNTLVRVAHKFKRSAQLPITPADVGGMPLSNQVPLSGIVYTSIFSVFDRRKNWQDMLTAFLTAMADNPEVTLVLKLTTPAHLETAALQNVHGYYHALGIKHRCRVVLVASFLSDQQMRDLEKATTYYVNASHAEGLCMPLQDYLAAGRPGIAPKHTAMLDYFDDSLGFVVRSSAEPTPWPHDPRGYMTSTWQRIDWQSLHDQFIESYRVALNDPMRYAKMSRNARQRMRDYASIEKVAPHMEAVLDELTTRMAQRKKDH